MKLTKRLISLLLLVSMLASMAACGGDTPADPQTPADAPVSEETAEETAEETMDSLEARSLVEDGLPDKDYEGRTFRILTYDMTANDFRAEEMTGALVNDATYDRNTKVMERFNIALDVNGDSASGDTTTTIRNSIAAGDDEFDLAS